METLMRYFPDLSPHQQQQFAQLPDLYRFWNARINLISRQDTANLEVKHLLHSLAVAKVISFVSGTQVLDLGTGGGFPGIPLAILLPEVSFTLIDGTGKKIAAVQAIATALGLDNVRAAHVRAEALEQRHCFDFVVSRAVASLRQLLLWSQPLLHRRHRHAYPNGLIALKGGDLSAEIAELPDAVQKSVEVVPIQSFFPEPDFEEKWVVYVQG